MIHCCVPAKNQQTIYIDAILNGTNGPVLTTTADHRADRQTRRAPAKPAAPMRAIHATTLERTDPLYTPKAGRSPDGFSRIAATRPHFCAKPRPQCRRKGTDVPAIA